MTGLPGLDDMAMSPGSSAAGAIPTRPRPIARPTTISDLITNCSFILHPLRVDGDDLPQSNGQDKLPSVTKVSFRTAESVTSGRAGGLKCVNRSKRMTTGSHLKVAST